MEWNDESLDSDDFTQLEYFVLQAGRYGTLTAEHGSAVVESESVSFRVIILKNLPVSVADSPSRLHRLLRLYRSRAQPSCLLVLIFTTNSSSNEGVLPERLLCPPSLRNELGIWRVEFNPVAPSLVLKALTRIMSRSNQLPRTLLQLLANECAGDLRTAVNQLQFLAKSGDANVERAHSDPDFLADPLPPHLACWKRPPLAFNLDDILDQCQMNGDTIVAWLHENYLDFSPHMHSTQWSADRLSWADAYLSGGVNWRLGLTPAADWNSSQSGSYSARQGVITTLASRHYAALVIARSLLLSHGMADTSCDGGLTHRSSNSKRFHSFRSPSTHNAWKVARSHSDELTDVLSNRCQTPLKSASLLITSRRRAILDFIPICLSMTRMKNCFSIDDFEILSSICHIRRAPLSKTGTNRVSQRYESEDSTWRDLDGWICPQDAVLEGEALPIEEDQSDDQLGRGR
ncbi:cell cycle checkpoint protein [Paragonimus westermani]|uniref:Cell cycle checkpoint protein n=1 Tax=Paragonimus westermani TaxID=34504 RepID=A0A5J4P4C7_9TREM|nr:cell cycle checkpoint protein [Paragonimus westermani]